jgi:glycosyltransferase involved in cell wall biosynthesis
MTTLAVNIIARNGAEDLKELLPIVDTFADEIVVILDHRTSDNTKEVCSAYSKCKVFDYDWGDKGFCGARNTAIGYSASSYITWFDCDDRPTNASALADFKKSNTKDNVIYTFQIRNVPGKALFNQVRMFPNHPEVRFVYKIHETISHEVVGKGFGIAPFEMIVDHHGYKHNDKYSEKLIRNLPLIEEEIRDGGFCPTIKYTYAMNLLSLGYNDQAEYWLRKNISNDVKNSPFRDVYIFSILNVCKILVNAKRFSEADSLLLTGMIALPDFKEFHALRAHICYHTGDLLTARLAISNAKKCPIRNYAISTDWEQLNAQVASLEAAIDCKAR